NPVQGVNVTFTLKGTTRTGATEGNVLKTGTSNAQGRVILVHSATETGTDTIQVEATDLTPVERTVEWKPGLVDTITLTLETSTPTAGEDVTVKATLKDEHGNLVDDAKVRLISELGSHHEVD